MPSSSSALELAEQELGRLKTSCAQLSNDVRDLTEIHTGEFARIASLALQSTSQAERDRDEAIRMQKVEEERRRSYLAQLLEIKGNIRVLCRIRPVNKMDESKGGSGNLAVVRVNRETVRCDAREFEFDEVFSPSSTNQTVFEEALPMVESIFEGHHACIFAYGQTGSGKTHTMTGTRQDRGVNYRAVELLFERKKQMLTSGAFANVVFTISNVEIYNESVRDLLSSGSTKELQIRQDLVKGVHLPDCTLIEANQVDTIWNLMEVGQKNRAQALTKMNSESSRSHSIFIVDVHVASLGEGLVQAGKLILVDLAGSERPSKSEVSGERLKEAANINKSLSVLGKVIAALGAKSQHVPFRDSKLTYLLQDSMGAQNKVMMIVQTAPTQFNSQESMCTLLFGSSARSVQLGRAEARSSKPKPNLVQQNEFMAEKYQLQQRLMAAERSLAEALARAERAERLVKQHETTISKTEKDRDAAVERAAVQCRAQPMSTAIPTTMPRRLSSTSSTISRSNDAPRVVAQSRQSTAKPHSTSVAAPALTRSFGSQAERFSYLGKPPPSSSFSRFGVGRDENRNVSLDFGLKRRTPSSYIPPQEDGEDGYDEGEECDSPNRAPLPLPPPLSSSSSRSSSSSSMRTTPAAAPVPPPAPPLRQATPYSMSASTSGYGEDGHTVTARTRRQIDRPAPPLVGARSTRMSTFGGGPSRVLGARRASCLARLWSKPLAKLHIGVLIASLNGTLSKAYLEIKFKSSHKLPSPKLPVAGLIHDCYAVLAPLRIALIDDNLLIRRNFERLMHGQLGIPVAMGETRQDCIRFLERICLEQFDVAILLTVSPWREYLQQHRLPL
ncbi:hypothetical protein BASA81_001734 [Batrachochytrium salamandrivorans]|nr:hypothetical protein BASA81_001734 [Batrachochytrium salamandrivorans]